MFKNVTGKGKIKKEKECLLIAKSSKNKIGFAERIIKKIHSYKIPAIIRIESKAGKEFNKWADYAMK